MWDLIVSVPDHCLSFYFAIVSTEIKKANYRYIKCCSLFALTTIINGS